MLRPMESGIGDKVGSYELIRSLGKGGFGEVFEATHELTRRRVALKLLLPDARQNQQSARRFLREAEVLAQLEHPGIVRIHHCERLKDETIYIAMEYLEGQTLHAWMKAQPHPVPIEVALEIGKQIADAMVEVHAKDIIHRDLKPGNVFLVPDKALANGQRVKILDFGIAKMPPAKEMGPNTDLATGPTQVLGSEGYMAPEQYWDAGNVDKPADIYALGLLLFEMITGRRPFLAETSHELLVKLKDEEPPALQDLVPTAPAALSTFVSSMLAREPAQRPSMLRAQGKLARPWKREQTERPLPGLEPFSGEQAELFFGRQTEIQDVLARIERARAGERRWIQIEGPSGVGKTSLVQAGVLTRLEEQRSPGGGLLWRIARFHPSEDPVRGLAQALFTAYEGPTFKLTRGDIERTLREDDKTALLTLARAHTPQAGLLLLVVEQMEELFSLTADSPRFDALVAAALTATQSPVRMLSTMRRDFLHRLDQAPKLAALHDYASRYPLLPMDEAKLTQVVQGMVQRVGLNLSEGLAERIVRDAASADSRLALLGHTLQGLWTPEGTEVTNELYEASGGVSGALTRHANMLLEGLGKEGRERAKWLVLDLVQLGRGVPDTRRPRTMREILAAAGDDEVTSKVLMHLAGKSVSPSTSTAHNLRLLVLSDDPTLDPASQRVELVHETLLREERTIARWIDEERPRLERHADLESVALAWVQAGSQTNEGLPSGSLLDHYRLHTEDELERERSRRMISDRARSFLQAAERLSLRRRRVARALWAALALGVMTILLFAYVARREQRRAEATTVTLIKTLDKDASETDWELARIRHTLKLRREMQSDMNEDLSAMLLEAPTNVAVRVAISKASQRRSDLAREDGTLSQAWLLLEESKHIIDLGRVIDPSNEDLQGLLGLYHSKLGKVELARGDLETAQINFDEARDLSAHLSHDEDSADSLRIPATNDSEQGDLEMANNHPAKALEMYDGSIDLLERLVKIEKYSGDYNWSLLSETLCSSATALRTIGGQVNLKLARGRIERARQIQEPILQREPGNAYYACALARIHLEHAELLAEEGQFDGAASDYKKALDLGRELHAADPTRKPYGLALGESLRGYERLRSRQGDPAGAEEAKRERQDVALEFLSNDREDARFQRLLEP